MTTSRSPGTRQKITVLVFIVILVVIIWQVYALFKNDTASISPPNTVNNNSQKMANQPPPPPPVLHSDLPKPPLLTAEERQLLQLQQQNEAKYVSAVNQLQMLKIEKEIAETNKAIATAKLDTMTAEQKMGSSIRSEATTTFSPNLSKNISTALISNLTSYIVVSIAYLNNKWSAVLSVQGKLYQVSLGDVLPDTGAKVTEIDKYGVTLANADETRKISLVPII